MERKKSQKKNLQERTPKSGRGMDLSGADRLGVKGMLPDRQQTSGMLLSDEPVGVWDASVVGHPLKLSVQESLVTGLLELCSDSVQDPREMIAMLRKCVSEVCKGKVAQFFECRTSEQGALEMVSDPYGEEGEVPQSLVASVFTSRTDLLINNQSELARHRLYAGSVDSCGLKRVPSALLAVPVFCGGRLLGVLLCASEAGVFEPEERVVIKVLARVWAALYSSSQRAVQMNSDTNSLARMLNMVADMVDSADHHDLCAKIASHSCELLDAERCTLFRVDNAAKQLLVPVDGAVKRMPINSGLAGCVAVSGKPVNIPNAYKDPRFSPELDVQTNFRTRQMLCMPIRVGDETIGVAQLANKAGSVAPFSEADQRVFEVFGKFAGVVWQHREAFDASQTAGRRNAAMLAIAKRLTCATLDADSLREETIEAARSLANADRAALFLVDSVKQELKATFGGDTMCMPINAGIAGTVAVSGMPERIADAYTDARFNKAVDMSTGYRTQSVLAVPVKYEDQVVAVAQLVNKKSSSGTFCAFDREDEQLLESFGAFAGISIRIAEHHKQTQREKVKFRAMLRAVVDMVQVDFRQDIADLCENIIHNAKTLIGADRCAFFLVDKERGELYSSVADSVGHSQIRFPIRQGIAGEVARTGRPCNIPDAYSDDRFNVAIDKQLGYVTQNILCAPVADKNGDVLAVVQLINKHGRVPFDEEDEDTLMYFTALVAQMMGAMQLFKFVSDNAKNLEDIVAMSSKDGWARRQVSAMPDDAATTDASEIEEIDLVELTDAEREAVKTRDFDLHKYRSEEGRVRLMALIAYMFDSSGLAGKYRVDRLKLIRFVYRISSRYRDVPYHSFYHAFDVTQTLYVFVLQLGSQLREIEQFVLLVSGLCHDVDHMGLNNSFHYKAETPLGILSNAIGTGSPLEVHHCNVAFEILQDPTCDILSGFPDRSEATFCYKTMLRLILGTDMARHKGLMDEFGQVCSLPADVKAERMQESRELLLTMLLKAADVSNPTKPFETSRKWANFVMEEFYQQGDKEKDATGAVENPMMDRDKKTEMASGQIGFIDFVCAPFYALVAQCWPQFECLVEALGENRATWSKILETQRERMPSSA
eukprot:TRINITY_DN4878_c0_g1_i1.p1 TRINITY_DN4878_c0_g1~~TRINITY_DN4878_c0_g1_i1.p1  ORF type:complete len:1109 (+),score=377.15 TRINITY_DN4878_c0_g1_i1:754-4080(+)